MQAIRPWVGPTCVAAALVAPGVIGLVDYLSVRHQTGLPGTYLNFAPGESLTGQFALLTVGLSAALVSGALAIYHWAPARRLIHVLLFCCLLELFYRVAYGGAVSPGVLLSVPETSDRESFELLVGHPILALTLTLAALSMVYALVVSWNSTVRFALSRCMQAAGVALLLIVASLAAGAIQLRDSQALKAVVAAEVEATFPVDVAGALGAVAVDWADARRQSSSRDRFEFPDVHLVDAASRAGATEIYVIVIGETSRRINWSLFGYPRITTPRLDAMSPDLILFRRVTANATNTIQSVPLALTRASPATRGIARSEKSIVSLLKQAGFSTFWFSNQERSDALSNPISRIAMEADQVSFPGDKPAKTATDGFDSSLLTKLDDGLAGVPAGGKAVFFLHMEGSHFGYKERYPDDFSRFSDGQGAPRTLPGPQMRLVDEYDNSVYFTDYNVRGIIDRLARCGCKAGLLFFSDHGERLFDNGLSDSEFGHGFPTVSRQEIEVPFFFWLSKAYQETEPLLVARLKANARSVAQLHNLFETIVDLTGVDYAQRDRSLSLFSDQLRVPARLEVLNMMQETVSLPVGE
jgi:glucan phosphoethanolaminetransferase (alkaline phosphatase superfamily)